MNNDHDYDVLKPESTKAEIVAAVAEALKYWALDDQSAVIEVYDEFGMQTVESAKWSPAMTLQLIKRMEQETW